MKLGLIDKGGAWFTIKEQRIQGRDAAKQMVADNPELAEELEAKIKEAIKAK